MSDQQETNEAADGQSELTAGLGSDASIIRDAMRYRALRIKGICFDGLVSIGWEPDVLDSVLDKWILEGDAEQEKDNINELLKCRPGRYIRVA